jgi:hypothetical protein
VHYISQAQYGLRLKYVDGSYAEWDKALDDRFSVDKAMLRSGFEVGVDYWFRLKKQRVEFYPELAYGRSSSSLSSEGTSVDHVLGQRFIFNFHTQLYAFDINGDCDCPTFSKEGPSFQKGLFFHVTPGIEYQQYDLNFTPVSSIRIQGAEGIVPKVGIGIGMDLGISDYFTVTPQFTYHFYGAITWDQFGMDFSGPIERLVDVSTNPTIWQASLRLGFRQDYKKKRRR